jgi:hypothetical protein
MNIIQFPEDGSGIIEDIMSPIYDQLEMYKDELIYISLGGKINERVLHYKEKNGVSELKTNSFYQMVPSFVHNDSIQREVILNEKDRQFKCLCIIIESFSSKELENNVELIQHYSCVHDLSNMNVFLVNIYSSHDLIHKKERDISFLEGLLTSFCDKLDYNGIGSNHFMLCNYVKFKSPLENDYEKAITTTVKRVLQSRNYNKSHYEWFGYNKSLNYLLYDFVYLYEEMSEMSYSDLSMFMIQLQKQSPQSFSKEICRNKQIYYCDWKKMNNSLFSKSIEKTKYIIPFTSIVYNGNGEVTNNLFCYNLHDIMVSN